MVDAPAPSPPLTAKKRFTDYNAPLDTIYDYEASKALGRDYWRIGAAFDFYLDAPTDEKWVAIPLQYLTDGASVPSMFWNWLPPWGTYGQAAVVHDWLCEQLTITVKGVPTPITRADADRAFKQGMKALGVPSWKRNIMYIAVRVYSKYVALRDRFTNGGYDASKLYQAKLAYLKAHPVMIPEDNETVPFDV
jgi:hypothetical protein